MFISVCYSTSSTHYTLFYSNIAYLAVLFEVSAAEVDAEVLLLLHVHISPRSLSGVDLDIPEHEADDVIIIIFTVLFIVRFFASTKLC